MEFKLPTELELPQEIQTTHTLHKQGKLHHMLTIRVSLFAALTCITGGVVFYDTIATKLTAELALIVSFAGFLAGVFIFSRIQKARWDEKKEVMRSGRLDILSLILIALYIGLRVATQWYLEHAYRHDAHMISGITFSLIFGLMLGRLTGVLVTIHKTHRGGKIKGK
jgi:hypothetical protein